MGSDLSLKFLSWKLVMLLALALASRSSELMHLSAGERRFSSTSVLFIPRGLAKQSRPEHPPTDVKLDFFPDWDLCLVRCLMAYKKATEKYRQPSTALFQGISPPAQPYHFSYLGCVVKSHT